MLDAISSLFQVRVILKETFKRFPFVYLFIILSTFFTLLNIHDIHYAKKAFEYEILTLLYFLVIAFTSLRLFYENVKLEKKFRLILSILTILTLSISVFYFHASSIFLSLGLISTLVFAGFVFNDHSNEDFIYFALKGIYSILFAFVSCVLLAIGINIIVASIQYLFEFEFYSKIYTDNLIIIFSLLFPIFVLSNIEKSFTNFEHKINFDRIIVFVLNYIFTPLIFIFTLILYAYFLKIIITFTLPKGNLSWMILSFLLTSLLIKLLSVLIKDKQAKALKIFERNFYSVIITPLLFLYLAIGIRVYEYGFTQARYAVFFFAIWFTFITMYYFIRKSNFQLKHIFTSLFVLSLLASSSPVNSTIVTASSQVKRFESFLVKNSFLLDGELEKVEKELSLEQRVEISQLSAYIVKDTYALKLISPYFKDANSFKTAKDILKVLEIDYASAWQLKKDKKFIPYDFIELNDSAVSIKGFEYLNEFYINKNKQTKLYYMKDKTKMKILMTLENSILKIKFNKNKIEFNIKEHYEKLRKNGINKIESKNINDAILIKNVKGKNYKLQIKNLTGESKKGNLVISSLGAYLIF